MKKIFVLLCIFMLTISSVLALSKPRWDVRPIKVYIPGGSYNSGLMKSAFEQWQSKTYSAVWFNFLGENKKNEADITVHFVEKDTKCGSIGAIGCAHSYTNSEGFYTHVDLYIASKSVRQLVGDDGTVATKTTLIPANQLYRVMLHEIGHAIGIAQHSNDHNSIMFKYSLTDVNIPQELTNDDLQFVYNVYR